ncbi:hypothetical protein ACLS0R_13340 [Comamonas jiangduensis]|uniref:hypothetical protein n=1 Tax=Comamonas jiangduensis TaxID=1194168 RepID=UPI003BF7E1C1
MTAAHQYKPPVPQVVNKPTRMTAKKRAALQCLAYIGADFLEWGTPPYAVSRLAEVLGTDLSNLAKTMSALEREGLVVREVAESLCWNAIAQAHMPRRCVCYWLAETMEQDKVRAKAWKDGAEARSQQALERMFAPRVTNTQAPDVIEVSAREVSTR